MGKFVPAPVSGTSGSGLCLSVVQLLVSVSFLFYVDVNCVPSEGTQVSLSPGLCNLGPWYWDTTRGID